MSENQSEKISCVLLWRETLSKLPDNHFFELMRMYLGEIKTPYNKQKLIESLGSFLHKTETREKIRLLLSKQDVIILSAVNILAYPTLQLLTDFFKGTFPLAELYDILMNLEERLILFQYTDKNTGKRIYELNPILEDIIVPLINVENLFQPEENTIPCKTHNLQVSPLLLASLISFVGSTPLIKKQDGQLKKNVSQILAQKFPGMESEQANIFFQAIFDGTENLALFKKTDKGFETDYLRWNSFAQLSAKEQTAYLVSGACGKTSFGGLYQRATLALSLLQSIPEKGFTEQALKQWEILALNAKESTLNSQSSSYMQSKSRLTQIMEGLQPNDEQTTSVSPTEAAIRLGFLKQTAQTDNKKGEILSLYTSSVPEEPITEEQNSKGLVNMDSGFNVTILPGLNLTQLLPLTHFMDLVRFDTAVTFEVTKSSALRAFDMGMTPKTILQELEKYLSYPAPQHLHVSLDDWFNSYDAATLYRGYVLHIKDGKDVQNNPLLKKYIQVKLENSIYIMNFSNDEEALKVLAKSGFGNTGTVKAKKTEMFSAMFKNIQNPYNPQKAQNKKAIILEQEGRDFCQSLKDKVQNMHFTPQQEEGLLTRIQRKIILVPQQLQANSVRQEILEATGMDYSGKIYVAEQALSTGTLLELVYGIKAQEKETILGTVIKLDKKGNDATVTMITEPEHKTVVLSLGQAGSVRRLRGAIFKEQN